MNPDQLLEYKVDGLRDSSLNCNTQKALVLFKPAKEKTRFAYPSIIV